ncbi:MAG: ATP-binding protein [Oscillospiraceae bacterium]|nr:ATP-binding protein [Oscillospiraceae bacterium]
MRSISFRFFAQTAFMVMLSFIILGSVFLMLGRSYMMNERQQAIESSADDLAKLTEVQLYQGTLYDWDLRMAISTLAESTSSHMFITDADGVVISCSDLVFNCEHLGRQLDSAVLSALQGSGEYSQLTTLGGFYSTTYYVVGLPVEYDGDVAGYVFVGQESSQIVKVWSVLLYLFFATAIAILIIVMILAYISGRRQTRPLHEMGEAAERFAHGDFSARVSVDTDDDIGALANSFNKMAEALERSERRRDEFVANIAHELKTPMTTIAGFADGILDGTIPPEAERQYLETISSETKRLNRLVRNMLDMSRMDSEDSEAILSKTFDAGELLLQTLLVFERKINDKKLEVSVQLPEDAIIVRGDPDAINQVIYNLLENAVKFAPEGTELGVSLWKQHDKAYISIKNHGETIPPDELALIFDRFHKTDKSRSLDRDGVGLGLYIVKNILNSHREDIEVTSRDGITEFVFSLALSETK